LAFPFFYLFSVILSLFLIQLLHYSKVLLVLLLCYLLIILSHHFLEYIHRDQLDQGLHIHILFALKFQFKTVFLDDFSPH
jgi:hypothetical protein